MTGRQAPHTFTSGGAQVLGLIFKELPTNSADEAEKLILLGVSDEKILSTVKRFRESRKELVHEKAHFNQGTIKTAQDEARVAIELMHELEIALG